MAVAKAKVKRTGNCFESAATALLSGDHPLGDDAVLVHGMPTLTGGPYKGKRYCHAWLESPVGFMVFDTEKRLLVPADAYFRVGSIRREECVVYSRVEACRKMLEHGHYGPWDKKFYAKGIL